MKCMLFFLLLCASGLAGQNVGIGTNAPLSPLEVKRAARSTLRISSNNFNDTSELVISNRNSISEGTDFSLTSVRENGLFFSTQSDVPANSTPNILVLRPTGQVGVGIVPTSRLHVNGTSRYNGLMQLDGTNLFEFGAGIAGKEANAGTIGYNAFGQNALTVVGAGTTTSNRAVYFFAEGGTTFTGPVDVYGAIRPAGNPGTAGQVLTSNGSGTPAWTAATSANTNRFMLGLLEIAAGTGSSPVGFSTTAYNLNPAEIIIGANSIQLVRGGLYRFTLSLNVEFLLAAVPASLPLLSVSLNAGGSTFRPVIKQPMVLRGGATYHAYNMTEFEIYIPDNTTISVSKSLSFAGTPTSITFDGILAGHLVAE